MANGGGIDKDHMGFGSHHAGFGGNPLGRAMAYSRSRLSNPQKNDWMSTPMVGPFASFLGNVPDNVDLPAGMPQTTPIGYGGLPPATSPDQQISDMANPFSRNAPHAIGLMGFEGRSPISDAVGRVSLGRSGFAGGGISGRGGPGYGGGAGSNPGAGRSGGASISGPSSGPGNRGSSAPGGSQPSGPSRAGPSGPAAGPGNRGSTAPGGGQPSGPPSGHATRAGF